MDIVSELKKLPNCGYTYGNHPGKGVSFNVIVLGRSSCPVIDDTKIVKEIIDTIGKMEITYLKGSLSNGDKELLAKYMERMLSVCEAKTPHIRTLSQQEDLINSLTDGQKLELCELISMYKECYAYYLGYR